VFEPSPSDRTSAPRRARRPRLPKSGLWANLDFLHLWSAETISQFGAQLSVVALPLLAVAELDATPFQMGLLGTVGTLPYLLIGLLAGAWVDRMSKRTVMLVTDLGRGIVLLAIPIAAALDQLSMWLLLTIAFVVGVQSVFFNAAYGALVPRIVPRDQLTDANGKLLASSSASQVIGPAIGGTLVALISGPLTMLINAVTFLGSAHFIRRITPRPEMHASGATRNLRREIREGMHALVASPVLRSITLSTMMNNLAGYLFIAVYVLYMTDDLHLSDRGVGLVFASGGVGALIGSLVAAPLTRRFGQGNTIVAASIGFGVSGLTVPMAILAPDHALPLVVFAEFAQWMTVVIFNTNRIALRQALTPDHLQGRVAASSQVITVGAQPIGSFLGGVIGSVWSVQAALIVGVIGMFLAFLFVWFSPTRSMHDIPQEPDPSLVALGER